MLKHVKARSVSHALIETCFIDDLDDMKLYGAKFAQIAQAIADGVAEGFGKTVQQTAPEKEDDEMVENKTVQLDGSDYTCSCIVKSGEHYVRLRDLEQAGYDVTYDAGTQTPGIAAPQTRIFAPENDEVQAAVDRVQTACGLEDRTMDYLIRYEYGDDLLRKLAAAIG